VVALAVTPARWDHQPETERSGIMVDLHRLDEFIDSEIGVMKLDVEFHEVQVLEGAGKRLRNVRDIVFEEAGPYPQESHKFLERAGYRIVWFEEHLTGPRIIGPTSRPKLRSYDTPPS
jgi:Methyltransferase FkbM domain